MNDKILGIDLGTTNSEVALYENGKVTIIEGPDGKMLPSYVGLDDKGGLLVGAAAMNQYVLNPERTIKSIKRRMGENAPIVLGDRSYSAQEISAMILRQLKLIAEEYIGASGHEGGYHGPGLFLRRPASGHQGGRRNRRPRGGEDDQRADGRHPGVREQS